MGQMMHQVFMCEIPFVYMNKVEEEGGHLIVVVCKRE